MRWFDGVFKNKSTQIAAIFQAHSVYSQMPDRLIALKQEKAENQLSDSPCSCTSGGAARTAAAAGPYGLTAGGNPVMFYLKGLSVCVPLASPNPQRARQPKESPLYLDRLGCESVLEGKFVI